MRVGVSLVGVCVRVCVGPGTAPVGVSSRNQRSLLIAAILTTKHSARRVGALHSGIVMGPSRIDQVGVASLGTWERLLEEGVSAGREGVEVEVQGGECCRGDPGLGAEVDLDSGGLGAVRRCPLDQDVG